MPENISPKIQLSSSQKRLLIVLGLVLLGGVLLQQYLKRAGGPGMEALPKTSEEAAGEAATQKISVKVNTKNWQEYKNEKLGFTVRYPSDFELRGRVDSDVAILTYPDKNSLVTLARKIKPRNEGAYGSVEEMWKDEEPFIGAQSGEVKKTRWIEIEKRKFFEAEEDNRLNNFVALHRYLQESGNIFEITLTVAGEKFDDKKADVYNAIVSTFVASK